MYYVSSCLHNFACCLQLDIEVQKSHAEQAREAEEATLAELQEQERQNEKAMEELMRTRNTITQELHGKCRHQIHCHSACHQSSMMFMESLML